MFLRNCRANFGDLFWNEKDYLGMSRLVDMMNFNGSALMYQAIFYSKTH
jgi:hypothetical protein